MSQYRRNFDHLGQLRAGDFSPWTRADKAILVLFVVVILALCTGKL